MWQHNYQPVGASLGLSALVAASPIFVLFVMLGLWRKPPVVLVICGLWVRFPPGSPYQLMGRRTRSRDWSTDEAMSKQTRVTLARYDEVWSEREALAVRIDEWARRHRTSFGSS